MNDSEKRVLIVGASSKIAQLFIENCPPDYKVYGTYRREPVTCLPADCQYQLNLNDPNQIDHILLRLSEAAFDAVLFFAATYNPDSKAAIKYFTAFQEGMQLSWAGPIALAKGLRYRPNSKLFLFGDAGLEHPKKGFTTYSLVKSVVVETTKLLAVELAPATACVCIRLGPTLRPASKPEGAYYDRGLLKVDEPAKGLVHLLHFIITEDNFNATGCIIDYDGGAYLRRL